MTMKTQMDKLVGYQSGSKVSIDPSQKIGKVMPLPQVISTGPPLSPDAEKVFLKEDRPPTEERNITIQPVLPTEGTPEYERYLQAIKTLPEGRLENLPRISAEPERYTPGVISPTFVDPTSVALGLIKPGDSLADIIRSITFANEGVDNSAIHATLDTVLDRARTAIEVASPFVGGQPRVNPLAAGASGGLIGYKDGDVVTPIPHPNQADMIDVVNQAIIAGEGEGISIGELSSALGMSGTGLGIKGIKGAVDYFSGETIQQALIARALEIKSGQDIKSGVIELDGSLVAIIDGRIAEGNTFAFDRFARSLLDKSSYQTLTRADRAKATQALLATKFHPYQDLFSDTSTQTEPEAAEQPAEQTPFDFKAIREAITRGTRQEAHQSEMEGYQSKLAQDKSEAQRQAEAESQSYVEVEQAKALAEAQQQAAIEAEAETQKTLYGQLMPTAPAAQSGPGLFGGMTVGELGQSGAGGRGPYSGTRASGGLVQNMYDGGVVRMQSGGSILEKMLGNQEQSPLVVAARAWSHDPEGIIAEYKDLPTYLGEMGVPVSEFIKTQQGIIERANEELFKFLPDLKNPMDVIGLAAPKPFKVYDLLQKLFARHNELPAAQYAKTVLEAYTHTELDPAQQSDMVREAAQDFNTWKKARKKYHDIKYDLGFDPYSAHQKREEEKKEKEVEEVREKVFPDAIDTTSDAAADVDATKEHIQKVKVGGGGGGKSKKGFSFTAKPSGGGPSPAQRGRRSQRKQGGVVGMADGGPPPPIPKKKPDKLDRRLRNISEATGSDQLRGSEVREYVESIRRGEIDDPDFLRTYEATRKGLNHYTQEEIKSMGMEDPWLPPAIKRTTPESRKIRELLTETRGEVPLVELGLDPTRLVTSTLNLNVLGQYSPREIDSRIYSSKDLMERQIAASDRPDLYEEGDYIAAGTSSYSFKTIAFHEAAHRGIAILERTTDFKLPKLTEELKIATDTTSEEDLLHEHLNNEIWVRLLEQKYYPSDDTDKKSYGDKKYTQRELQTLDNNEYIRKLYREGLISVPQVHSSSPIDRMLSKSYIKEGLEYIRDSSRKELEERGFPKIKDDEISSFITNLLTKLGLTSPTKYRGGVVKPMYDGGLV